MDFQTIMSRARRKGHNAVLIEMNPEVKFRSTLANDGLLPIAFALGAIEVAKKFSENSQGKMQPEEVLMSLLEEIKQNALSLMTMGEEPGTLDLTEEEKALLAKVDLLTSADRDDSDMESDVIGKA
jgi:AAA+ ATPase superfamily predicted ATPase